MTECIKFEQVSHIYMPDTPFEKKSLDRVSFSVHCGEYIGIIGHTGSGKSTLIQMLNAYVSASSDSGLKRWTTGADGSLALDF